jgi:LysR family transcriptional regulator for metE and metH
MQSYRWLPGVLAIFNETHPGVEVTVVSEAAVAPSDWLIERRLDVALVGPGHVDKRVSVARLFRDELVAVVGREHPWFGKRRVAPAAFESEHVWTDNGALDRETPLGRALAEAGDVVPRKITRVPMTGTIAIDMARANLGVTVVPKWVVEPLLADDLGTVRVGKGLWLDWSIATRNEKPDSSLAAFVAALRKNHPKVPRDICEP